MKGRKTLKRRTKRRMYGGVDPPSIRPQSAVRNIFKQAAVEERKLAVMDPFKAPLSRFKRKSASASASASNAPRFSRKVQRSPVESNNESTISGHSANERNNASTIDPEENAIGISNNNNNNNSQPPPRFTTSPFTNTGKQLPALPHLVLANKQRSLSNTLAMLKKLKSKNTSSTNKPKFGNRNYVYSKNMLNTRV